MPNNQTPNPLITEKSPYLLQHAPTQYTGIRGGKKHSTKRNVKINRCLSALDTLLATGGTANN